MPDYPMLFDALVTMIDRYMRQDIPVGGDITYSVITEDENGIPVFSMYDNIMDTPNGCTIIVSNEYPCISGENWHKQQLACDMSYKDIVDCLRSIPSSKLSVPQNAAIAAAIRCAEDLEAIRLDKIAEYEGFDR